MVSSLIRDHFVHDDAIKWKHFPRHWSFVRGIHWSSLNSPNWRRALIFFFDLCLNKRLSKQSWGWWFETPSCSSWRHYNVYATCQWETTLECNVVFNWLSRTQNPSLIWPEALGDTYKYQDFIKQTYLFLSKMETNVENVKFWGAFMFLSLKGLTISHNSM